MGILPAVCICLVFLQLDSTEAQGPFGAEQNIEGLYGAPRSNVIVQSVDLNGRRSRLHDHDLDGDRDCGGGHGLRHLLRRLLGSLYPFPYKKGEPEGEENDAETIDTETLERMVKAAKKMKLRRRDKENDDEDEKMEIDRLVDLERERDKPRRFLRVRDGRKRREGMWRRLRHEDDEEDISPRERRKKPREEDDDVGKRWRSRRIQRRREREWEDEDSYKKPIEEERHKKTGDEEWGSPHKSSWHRRNHEGRDILYLPPQYPQSRHLLRPRSSEEYVK